VLSLQDSNQILHFLLQHRENNAESNQTNHLNIREDGHGAVEILTVAIMTFALATRSSIFAFIWR
jgi:hypothetical protein